MRDRFDIEQVLRITGLGIHADQADGGADFDVACNIAVKKIRKAKEYEDLEEQGKMLRLPCAVGDIIYEVSYENRELVIKEHIVKEFVYRKYRFPRIEIYCENENGFLVCNSTGKLDECLFLTRPEAERALAEMEGKK